MQSLLAVFDAQTFDAKAVARLENEIWKELKLSGELNRVRRENKWLLHFTIEKNIKEENLKKSKALEAASEVKLRDLVEDIRSKKKHKNVNVDAADDPGEAEEAPRDDD